MRNTKVFEKSSWANKGVSLFTSLALVMAVTIPSPAYAAESSDTEAGGEAPAMVMAENAPTEGTEAVVVEEAAEDTIVAEPAKQEAPAAVIEESPVVEAEPIEDQAEKTEAAQVEKPKAEEPKAEGPKAEAAKAENPKAEEPKAEESKADEVVAEAEKAEEEPAAKTTPVAEEVKATNSTATVKAAPKATLASENTPASVDAQANAKAQVADATPAAEPAAKTKAATPKATATLGQFQVQGDEGSYAYENNVLTVMGDVMVSTIAKTSERIVVAADATVTLSGVEIEASDAAAGITVESNVNAVINLVANTINNVVGGKNHAGIEVAWQSESDFASLAIEGEGELNAKGGSGNGGAGIGGSYAENAGLYGDITINGGTVNAEGTNRAAGIGSSNNPTNYGNVNTVRGDIVINGGDVTAKGVGNGAGIGGGNHMSSGMIVINGGTVYAEGDSGIGSGLGSSSGADKGPGHFWADVTINGGDVTAYATDNMGAGIGGGMYSDAYVTINGGTVNSSVNLDGKAYQGGAGIGGGYQGAAIVTINGGAVTAYGGNGSAGIGNGALAANTTSKNYSEAKGWYDTKNVRTGAPKIAIEDSKVEIAGGTVVAYGGYAGAGIGSGNSSEWVNVIISGGDVTAIGYASTEDEMEGAAGIGSGASWVKNKIAYMKETIENITITGGNVIAIGGWGAAGIGSGAKNATADSITIDAENANVQAYADGTKFAIDTPADNAGSNANVTGNILQGTFVHEYTDDEGNNQGTEGLNSIILKNEATGEVKQLTLMPESYRSYAATVNGSGIYSVYTDSNAIGASGENANGSGAHFSVYASDQWNGDEEGNKPVTYGVVADELSNYLYLFPVKTVVVETTIEIAGAADEAAEELASNISQTFRFAIHTNKGDVLKNADGNPWILPIEVINGIAQGNAYFANMNDGQFEIWEVDENGESLVKGMQFGNLVLQDIRTEHGEGTDNNAEIGKGIWKDVVRIVNVFAAIPVEVDEPEEPVVPETPVTPEAPEAPAAPEAPEAPENAETPETPKAPEVPEAPVAPEAPEAPAAPEAPETPESPKAPENAEIPEAPAAPEAPENVENPEAPEAPVSPANPQGSDEQSEPAAPIVPAGPTTPSTPASPTTPTTPSTPAGPTTPATPTAPMAITAGTITETAVSTVATAATTTGAVAEAAAPAATALVAQEAIADDATPMASSVEAEAIADDATPMAGHEHGVKCWVHWWMLLGMLVTAIYTVIVVIRRTREDEQDDTDQDSANSVQDNNENPFGYGKKLQTATFMTQEA